MGTGLCAHVHALVVQKANKTQHLMTNSRMASRHVKIGTPTNHKSCKPIQKQTRREWPSTCPSVLQYTLKSVSIINRSRESTTTKTQGGWVLTNRQCVTAIKPAACHSLANFPQQKPFGKRRNLTCFPAMSMPLILAMAMLADTPPS